MNNSEFQTRAEQIDRLVQRVSTLGDEAARTMAFELLQSTMDLHGAALTRIVDLLSQSGDAGRSSLTKLGSDPLICGLLVLYGIHPVSLEDRVTCAIEKLGPQLRKNNATVQLISVSEEAVRVIIHPSGHGCGSSEMLKSLAQRAILEAAPELVEVIVDSSASSASGFVPLNTIQSANKEAGNYEKSTA